MQENKSRGVLRNSRKDVFLGDVLNAFLKFISPKLHCLKCSSGFDRSPEHPAIAVSSHGSPTWSFPRGSPLCGLSWVFLLLSSGPPHQPAGFSLPDCLVMEIDCSPLTLRLFAQHRASESYLHILWFPLPFAFPFFIWQTFELFSVSNDDTHSYTRTRLLEASLHKRWCGPTFSLVLGRCLGWARLGL